MRPGRLGEIFDGGRYPLVAFDEKHVGGLQGGAERLRIGRREGLVAGGLAGEEIGDQPTDPVEKPVGHLRPQRLHERAYSAASESGSSGVSCSFKVASRGIETML
jgi:hypothetical protein